MNRAGSLWKKRVLLSILTWKVVLLTGAIGQRLTGPTNTEGKEREWRHTVHDGIWMLTNFKTLWAPYDLAIAKCFSIVKRWLTHTMSVYKNPWTNPPICQYDIMPHPTWILSFHTFSYWEQLKRLTLLVGVIYLPGYSQRKRCIKIQNKNTMTILGEEKYTKIWQQKG